MATIVEINNPFEPFKETAVHTDVGSLSVLDWLNDREVSGKWEKYERPTICLINGEAVMQADYGKHKLEEDDIVNFVVLVGDPITIIIAVVVAVVAVAAILAFAPQPPGVGETPEPQGLVLWQGGLFVYGRYVVIPAGVGGGCGAGRLEVGLRGPHGKRLPDTHSRRYGAPPAVDVRSHPVFDLVGGGSDGRGCHQDQPSGRHHRRGVGFWCGPAGAVGVSPGQTVSAHHLHRITR